MRLFPKTLIAASATVLALGLSLSPDLHGADADPVSETRTVMTVRGKLLFRDTLDQPLEAAWRSAKGKWEVVDASLRGSEVPSDHHSAATRYPIKFRDAVIQYSFKLDGAKATALSLNDSKGHVCRVMITPNEFSVRKDDHDHAGPDKAAVLQTRKVEIAPGRWHTLLVEFKGPEILARIDEETVALEPISVGGAKAGKIGKSVPYWDRLLGSNDALDVDKTNLGLIVSGTSVSFRNLLIWEAQPNPDWSATRAKLAATTR